MYTPLKHGRAQYGNYYEIPESIVIALTSSEGSDSLPLSDQRFATLVYQVNPTQVDLSGITVEIGSVAINDKNNPNIKATVDTSGNLYVLDQNNSNLLTQLIQLNSLSRLITSDDNYTYIAEAFPGSLSSNSVWRIKRIDISGNTMWADGNSNFDNNPQNIFSLTYSF